jgi:segregation and condensation protein A
VRLEQFSGPLQLLLDLIEREDLPITDVSLAKVADDYLRYVNSHEVPAEELADFLVVAAKLLLIKSNAILPVPDMEEDADPGQLAAQLRIYREFVQASKTLESLYASGHVMFGREKPYIPVPEKFLPPRSVTGQTLFEAFENLMKKLEPFFALKEASMRRVVSVQERIRDIQRAILERARMSFRDVIGGASSRAEVVVSFLALLELVKQRIVHAVQGSAFEDITLKRVE